jgi:hypothetical protein
MSDVHPQRQVRNGVLTPPPETRDPISPEQRAVDADRKARQQAAQSDPYLNGQDSLRRMRGND